MSFHVDYTALLGANSGIAAPWQPYLLGEIMGEKGNLTSGELASGGGAVLAGAGTQVTAVFQDAADSLKSKVIDKSVDAGIAGAQEKWTTRKGNISEGETPPGSPDDGQAN